MKPQVDYNRAFAFLMEGGEDELDAYMNRLNSEHFWSNDKPKASFNEDGTPKKKAGVTRKDPEQMTTEQLVNEMQARGLEEYEDKKVKEKTPKKNAAGLPVPAPKGTPKSQQTEDGYLAEIVETTQRVPKKYSDKEMVRQIKEDMDADDAAKPAPKQKITEKLKLRDMKKFPEDALYVFLQQKSNSREASDIAIMRGKTLQGRLSLNADGTRKKTSAIAADVEEEIGKKFKNFKNLLRAAKKTPMLEELMARSLDIIREGTEADRVKLSGAEIVNEVKEDRQLLQILGMFKLKGDELDEQIFKFYFDRYPPKKKVGRTNRAWNNYVEKNIRLGFDFEMKVDEAIRVLDNEIPEYMIPVMLPFKNMLKQLDDKKERGEGQYRISELRGSQIIGRIDTKDVKRREEIYEYWGVINGKFEEFQKSHNEFKDAMDKLDGYSSELEKLFGEFKAFKTNDLNYIELHDRVEIEDIDNIENKSVVIFEQFLKDINRYPKQNFIVQEEEYKDDVSRYGELVQSLEAQDTEEELKDKVNNLMKTKVDPLYAYAIKTGEADELVAGTFVKKQLNEIKRRLKTGLVLVERSNLIPALDRYMKDLEKMEVGSLDNLYLPLMKEIKGGETDKVHGRIAEYLKLVNEFIEYGTDFERSSKGGNVGLGQRERKDDEGKTIREARSPRVTFARAGAGKTHLRELKTLDVSDKFENLIDSIVEFFIEPSGSKFKPSDEKLGYVVEVGSRPIENIAKETTKSDSPFMHVLRMENTDFTLSLSQIEDIRDFTRLLTGLNVGSKQNDLMTVTKKLADTIDDIFQGELTEMINIEFGNFLHNIFSDAKLKPKRFGLQGSKKMTNEWSEQYESQKLYPFESILNHLIVNKPQYKDKVKGSEAMIGNIQQAEKDLKITKSVEQSLLLKAHDEIRNMMGKPVYYGMSNIDNYDAVSEAIDVMNDKYKVDMTAMDIERVVKEIDSMHSIGTKYGIPQEGVYFLKANFR